MKLGNCQTKTCKSVNVRFEREFECQNKCLQVMCAFFYLTLSFLLKLVSKLFLMAMYLSAFMFLRNCNFNSLKIKTLLKKSTGIRESLRFSFEF